MRRDLKIFNSDGSMNRDPLGEDEFGIHKTGTGEEQDMGRWMEQKGPRPDICKHGNHATSLKNLEMQFVGAVDISPCPVCLAEMREEDKKKQENSEGSDI